MELKRPDKHIINQDAPSLLRDSIFVTFVSIVFVLFVVHASLLLIFVHPSRVRYKDYVQYYSASQVVKEGKGNKIYDLNTQKEYHDINLQADKREYIAPFRNPAFATVFYLPFTGLSLIDSYGVFTIFNFLLFIIIGYFITITFKFIKHISYSVILLTAYCPTTLSIIKGQITLLMTFFSCCFTASLNQNHL